VGEEPRLISTDTGRQYRITVRAETRTIILRQFVITKAPFQAGIAVPSYYPLLVNNQPICIYPDVREPVNVTNSEVQLTGQEPEIIFRTIRLDSSTNGVPTEKIKTCDSGVHYMLLLDYKRQ
jgi:hypothetical protein